MRYFIIVIVLCYLSFKSVSQSTFVFSGYSAGQNWTSNGYSYANTQNGTTMTTKISHNSNPGWFNLTGATSPNYASYAAGSCASITGLFLATNRASTTPTVTMDMSFSPSVCGPVTFTIADVNGGDNSFRDDITITAYDQTGTAIALTTAMVSRNGATSCNGGNLGTGYVATSGNSLKVSGCTYDNCNANYFTISSATKMISRITIDYASGNRDWSGNTITDPALQYIMISNIKAYTPVINIATSCVSNPITLTGSIAGGGFPPTSNPTAPYPAVVSLPTAPTYAWVGSTGTLTSPTALATTVSGLTAAGGSYTLTVQNNKGCVASNSVSVSSVNCSILPIELISFEANNAGSDVKINWKTAMEKNNSHFEVERSGDGINFDAITRVNGKGNSSSINDYTFADTNPLDGISYYRLKQVDHDGTYQYSEMVSVESSEKSASISNIFPNPAFSEFSFDFFAAEKGELNYSVIDCMGRVMISKKEMLDYGKTTLNLSLNDFPDGVYFLKAAFETGSFPCFKKIIKSSNPH